MLLPKALSLYRSLRAPSNLPPQPLSTRTTYALNTLFLTALLSLLSTLPVFAPSPSIFHLTSSRLQTPDPVLFTRLAALGPLSPADESLRSVFETGGLEARLLYLRFGKDVLASSAHIVADAKDADTWIAYLIFALPALLKWHLLHITILGLVTSAALAGKDAARWRTLAVGVGVALAVADVASVATYDHSSNARAVRTSDLDVFFWKRRLVSRLAVAAVDGVVGWVIYLTATRRAFVRPTPPAEKVEAVTRRMEALVGRLRGLGAIRNVVARDRVLRGRVERYWVQEQEVMRAVCEDREVVGVLNQALDGLDMGRVEGDAEGYVEQVFGGMQTVQGVAL